ncbi:MAG: histidine kinase dimerization/phosphoacceptor domain -containing protein [Spirochaetota bacterium]
MGVEKLNHAFVRVANETGKTVVPISTDKPEIPQAIIDKWQGIVDMVARIMHVPTGLITRLTEDNLEIFVASRTEGNPYSRADKDSLGIGMFCETVASRRQQMLVQDTNESDYWRNNPHAALGMRSYLGVPIQWEDGEVFGTFCMLNDKTNRFTPEYQELMIQFKGIIETDLSYMLLNEELKRRLTTSELYLRELQHRVKNHFNLIISSIGIQKSAEQGHVHQVLMDLQNRIRSVALIHEQLHKLRDSREPLVSEYLHRLCETILDDFAPRHVDLSCDIDEISLSVDASVPIGLIVSELLSNSLKYAFADVPDPAIRLSIKADDRSRVRIVYEDNGPGYPPELDSGASGSIGITLITALTRQLAGEPEFSSASGARYEAIVRV